MSELTVGAEGLGMGMPSAFLVIPPAAIETVSALYERVATRRPPRVSAAEIIDALVAGGMLREAAFEVVADVWIERMSRRRA